MSRFLFHFQMQVNMLSFIMFPNITKINDWCNMKHCVRCVFYFAMHARSIHGLSSNKSGLEMINVICKKYKNDLGLVRTHPSLIRQRKLMHPLHMYLQTIVVWLGMRDSILEHPTTRRTKCYFVQKKKTY